jgi:2-phospho-L-lactate/phosphoenolpyruvate guanylyltransferase
MKAILVPVKDFALSKQRLSPHFAPAPRAALAQALCEDMFRTVAKVRGIDAVFVASKESWALERARSLGWECLVESEQISESHSVDAASGWCAARGTRALLRLPIDLPLATAADIESLFDVLEDAPAAVLAPSRDGTGTNALLRAPPDLFPSFFGPGSLAHHLRAAEDCGAKASIVRNAHLALDIDEWDDLAALGGQVPPDSATAQWMARHFNSGRDPFPPGG